MFSALNQRLLAFAQSRVKPVRCPRCGETFKPFADQEVLSWMDLTGPAPCPHCGFGYSLATSSTKKHPSAAPPMRESARRPSQRVRDLIGSPKPVQALSEPLLQPAGSRIEKRPVSESELLFHIPASGKAGFFGCFAVLWNGFLLVFLTLMLGSLVGVGKMEVPGWQAALFFLPFVGVGIGMGYAALRMKYATHLLFLGPDLVRLQRQLFSRRKNYDLPAAEVDRVEQNEFYRQNDRPIYGIEVAAGRRTIRFGSVLTDEEKWWLIGEIRAFFYAAGNPNFPEPGEVSAEPAQIEPITPAAPTGQPANSQIVREQTGRDEIHYNLPPSAGWQPMLIFAVFAGAITSFLLVQLIRDVARSLGGQEFDFFHLFAALSHTAGLLIVGPLFLAAIFAGFYALRTRGTRPRLTLTAEEVRLEIRFLWQTVRTLPTREIIAVERVEFMKMNDKPLHTIWLRTKRRSLQTGTGLSEEDQRWLAGDIRAFLQTHGAPLVQR